MIYGMIYLLTAIGLSPGGSSTVHIYTQTVHRTTQNRQYLEQHNNLGRVRAVPRLGELYPGICLTTEEKTQNMFKSKCKGHLFLFPHAPLHCVILHAVYTFLSSLWHAPLHCVMLHAVNTILSSLWHAPLHCVILHAVYIFLSSL